MHTKKRARYAYLFILPFFLVFLVFNLYPLLYTLYISFCDYDALSGAITFLGLDNYVRLFRSSYFFGSIYNTLIIWILSIVPQLLIALTLALLLNNKWVRGRSALRAVYYFPYLVTPVTIGVLFGIFYSYPGGTLNVILKALGLTVEGVNFGYSPVFSRMGIASAICWQYFGNNLIFFTAGLNTISGDVLEAAEVDGASAWTKATRITLPLMKPVLLYVMITSIIGGLQIFDVSKMVFTDTPGKMHVTMVQYMYESAFERWQLGYGAANGYAIFMIIMILSVATFKITSRGEGGVKE